MKDQLIKILESEGLTPAKLADEIGVQRSSISHILSNRNKPSYDFILKILNRFSGINAEWLITGKGNMIKGETVGQMKVVQQDLFHDYPDKGNKRKSIENTNNENNLTIDDNTIKAPMNKVLKEEINDDALREFTNVNNLNYIVIFYRDGTFEKFIPRG